MSVYRLLVNSFRPQIFLSGDRLRVVSRTLSVDSRFGSARCEVRIFTLRSSKYHAHFNSGPQRKDMEYDKPRTRRVRDTHKHGAFKAEDETLRDKSYLVVWTSSVTTQSYLSNAFPPCCSKGYCWCIFAYTHTIHLGSLDSRLCSYIFDACHVQAQAASDILQTCHFVSEIRSTYSKVRPPYNRPEEHCISD